VTTTTPARQGGPPTDVTAVLSALREALPHESLRWSADLDAELIWWLHANQVVRDAHLPLIEALEAVLLPLRVDGAQDLDPSVGVRRLGGEQVVGDYGIALCRQPDAAAWCVLCAGIAVDLPFTPTRDRQHDNARGRFVLPLPAPTGDEPVVYGAEVSTGPFGGLASRWESSPASSAGAPSEPGPGSARGTSGSPTTRSPSPTRSPGP
jgi:hypothetical protein